MIVLMIYASLGRAQDVAVSPEAALACFEQSRRDGFSHSKCAPGIVRAEVILRQRDRFPPVAFQAVLEGLGRLALTSDDRKVRVGAILQVASLGSELRPPDEQVHGIVARLAELYWQSSDIKGNRNVIVEEMSFQAEEAQAIEFLKAAAKEERPEYRQEHMPPPYLAVATLAIMGPPGQAALQSLFAEGSVTNTRASGYLQDLSKHSFKDPSMR